MGTSAIVLASYLESMNKLEFISDGRENTKLASIHIISGSILLDSNVGLHVDIFLLFPYIPELFSLFK